MCRNTTPTLSHCVPVARRKWAWPSEGTATSFQNSREAVPLSAPADAAATGRKRKAQWHLTHLFLLRGHHDCFLSNQRPGVARAPNRSSHTARPDHWTGTTTLAIGCLSGTLSHTAFKSQEKSLRSRCRSSCNWLAVLSADSDIYRFSAVYWRTLFCHWAGPNHFLRD
jgi:hypothetical protein